MLFAIRDDDLNYYYKPDDIERWYDGIWNKCPISMSVIPFIKGNWPNRVAEAEKKGPGKMSLEEIKEIVSDDAIYPIGKNKELVEYITGKLTQNKVYLTIHAIHHRNEDEIIPQYNNNYGLGAEFFTERDLTKQLSEAISYIEKLFNQKITVFTPPQNLYNLRGMNAVKNNNLNVCGDLPAIRNYETVRMLGVRGYISRFIYRLFNKNQAFPFVLKGKKIKLVSHIRLQPGSNIQKIFRDIDYIHNKNGICVISTHSYGFDYKMKESNDTMGETLKKILYFVTQKKNVEFVSLGDIFKK